MPILFGWGKTTVNDHGECIAATCPRCHNSVVLHHIYLTVWFTLFFIPVIPYKRRRSLVCPICSWSREVPKTAVALTDEMNTITASWRNQALSDAEYEQRVAAYWAFQTDSPGTASATSSEQDQPLGPDA